MPYLRVIEKELLEHLDVTLNEKKRERERKYKTDEPAIANSPIPPTMGPDGRVLTDRI